MLSYVDPLLPLELRGSGNEDVLDYYRDLQYGATRSRRCRLMLLGAGGAGKTTLVRRLVTGAPVNIGSTTITHGIEQSTGYSACGLSSSLPPTRLCLLSCFLLISRP